MACTARRKALPSPGCYLQFDQERASDPRSRRFTSSRFYDAGRFLWRRLFRPRGTHFSGCWPCGRGCSSRPRTGYKGSLFCPSPGRYSLRKGAGGSRSDGGAGMDLRCGPWCSERSNRAGSCPPSGPWQPSGAWGVCKGAGAHGWRVSGCAGLAWTSRWFSG